MVGLDRLFVAFDADHNGFVDVHEFMQGIQAMSQVGTTDEKLRLLFLSHDARGTGLLGYKDISCILKTMYTLLDYPRVGRRARDAAAKAIVSTLSTKLASELEKVPAVNNNNEDCGTPAVMEQEITIDFEEFLALPDVQPDVLKIMAFNLPYASKKSAKKSAKRATACAAAATAAAAAVAAAASLTTQTLKRSASVGEVQQLKTSPRGDQ